MKKIGFTGTREELTEPQLAALGAVFTAEQTGEVTEVHHGDCVGADAAFHDLATRSGARTVGHPCDIKGLRANCVCDEVLPVKKPLDRNRDIVDAVEVLIACPEGPERQRSGTWSTIRFALRVGKPVVIVWPDGRVERK